jgi:hypothetical protein
MLIYGIKFYSYVFFCKFTAGLRILIHEDSYAIILDKGSH